MIDSIFYTADRAEWRAWLEEHFETEKEIWFVFPMKESGESSLSYWHRVNAKTKKPEQSADNHQHFRTLFGLSDWT